MIYTALLLIGLLGLVVMALLGGGHGHAGAGHGHAPALSHGNAHGHSSGHDHQLQGHGSQHEESNGGNRAADLFWSILSPITLFSLCLGAGVTGLVLQQVHLGSTMLAIASVIGALAFNGLLVRPMFRLVYSFASKPAAALEGATAKMAEAEGHFDAAGQGVVKLIVDGQIVRVLAKLEAEDVKNAPAIQPGDKLTVTSVDGRANTCRVTLM